MKTFNITDEDIYKKFKAQCVLNNKSMSKVIQAFMEDYAKQK